MLALKLLPVVRNSAIPDIGTGESSFGHRFYQPSEDASAAYDEVE
jgi:hypothetical protein